MTTVRRWVPTAWSLLLAILMLGGALGPGYVLTYDMVWVPDLRLSADALGWGSSLPRAVPSDAVIAIADSLLSGMATQKIVLVGSLVGAGAGGAALVSEARLGARVAAASLMIWNPFVVERLVIGHWPVLIGYAALPWLLLAGRRWEPGKPMPVAVPWLIVLGSLSASTGVGTAVAALASCGRRRARGRLWQVLGLVALANAPWLVAGLLHAGDARSAAAGAEVFATSGEGHLAAPLAALGLGGIWNAAVVPDSRTGFLAVLSLCVVGGLVALGVVSARTRRHPGMIALVTIWGFGYGVAVLSWGAPSVIGWLAVHVPGGGLLRDGSRLLGLCAPLLAVLAAHGVGWLLDRLPDRASQVMVAGMTALMPLAVMPDAVWGGSGELDAVHYPAHYGEARRAVADAPAGDVVVLPFLSYRAPQWNSGRRVFNPLGRYLLRATVTNDELVVDGEVLPGEDPRAADIGLALREPTANDRSVALARLGVSTVVAEHFDGVDTPEIAGEETLATPMISVIEIRDPILAHAPPGGWRATMLVAWGAWLGLLVFGVIRAARRATTRNIRKIHP